MATLLSALSGKVLPMKERHGDVAQSGLSGKVLLCVGRSDTRCSVQG